MNIDPHVLRVLLGPDWTGNRDPRPWWALPARLIGPGSVPLGLLVFLFCIGANPYWSDAPFHVFVGSALGSGVIIAAYSPKRAFALVAAIVVGISLVGAASWLPAALVAVGVTTFALARKHDRVLAVTWLVVEGVLVISASFVGGGGFLGGPVEPLAGVLVTALLVTVLLVVGRRTQQQARESGEQPGEESTKPAGEPMNTARVGEPANVDQSMRMLLGPDWTRKRDLDFSQALLLRLIGPGSVPLGFLLFIGCATYDDTLSGSAVLGCIIGGTVVLAAYLPRLAFVVAVAALAVVLSAVTTNGLLVGSALVAYGVSAFAISRRYDRVLATTLVIATAALAVGSAVVIDALGTPFGYSSVVIAAPATFAVVVVTLVVGLAVRHRMRVQGKLVRVEQDAAEERGHRQLLEERTRIAREMHDVVAHHMSVIAVQASTAEFRLPNISDEARTEFRSIAEAARESLTEMRRLLSVLRKEDQTSERMPQPGIEGIEALVDGAARAGTNVTVSIPDDLPELPDVVSLAAYRIVQEGLSNVVRHAEGAAATIELYCEDEWLVVLVMNDSPPNGVASSGAASGTETSGTETSRPEPSGLGISGMRERVALLKGELVAERLGRAGFVVKARLPLEIAEDS